MMGNNVCAWKTTIFWPDNKPHDVRFQKKFKIRVKSTRCRANDGVWYENNGKQRGRRRRLLFLASLIFAWDSRRRPKGNDDEGEPGTKTAVGLSERRNFFFFFNYYYPIFANRLSGVKGLSFSVKFYLRLTGIVQRASAHRSCLRGSCRRSDRSKTVPVDVAVLSTRRRFRRRERFSATERSSKNNKMKEKQRSYNPLLLSSSPYVRFISERYRRNDNDTSGLSAFTAELARARARRVALSHVTDAAVAAAAAATSTDAAAA